MRRMPAVTRDRIREVIQLHNSRETGKERSISVLMDFGTADPVLAHYLMTISEKMKVATPPDLLRVLAMVLDMLGIENLLPVLPVSRSVLGRAASSTGTSYEEEHAAILRHNPDLAGFLETLQSYFMAGGPVSSIAGAEILGTVSVIHEILRYGFEEQKSSPKDERQEKEEDTW